MEDRMSTATTRTQKGAEPLRFAHPFFTPIPPAARKATTHGRRMTDHVKGTLHPIPKIKGTSIMTLADLIGTTDAQGVEASGRLRFHTTGDTGKRADSPQGQVANAMSADYDATKPDQSPAFFLHLGDVIYGPGKDQHYRQEFYEPYMHYPGKIIAIPGNHDGETIPKSDPESLRAFTANFCAPTANVPEIAGSIFRQTMTQPGVYWFLDAPFLDIIGLYSNSAENPGYISGKIPGQTQKTWLVTMLKNVAKERKAGARKGLILATHHPPYSTGGHSGSQEMLADIDDVCRQAGIMPDLFLAAHAHTYQRYTRRITFGGKNLAIPFLVVGIGGYNAQAIAPARGEVTGDCTFERSHEGYGYALVEATKSTIAVTAFGVMGSTKTSFDEVNLNL
jgi:hypothetical protein